MNLTRNILGTKYFHKFKKNFGNEISRSSNKPPHSHRCGLMSRVPIWCWEMVVETLCWWDLVDWLEISKANRWMTWFGRWRRARQAAKCHGEVHATIEPWVPQSDFWPRKGCFVRNGNAGNWNILVPAGKEIKRDAVSNSERKPYKANWILCSNASEMWCYRTCF